MISKKNSIAFFACLMGQFLLAQTFFTLDSTKYIEFKNPSFESEKGASRLPKSWDSCNDTNDLLPDIQPGTNGVRLPPFQGKTYISLLANKKGSTGEFKHNLPVTLKAGNCYRFSLYLAKSEKYITQSSSSSELISFSKPLKLEIYGLRNDSCNLTDDTWLVETKAVHHDSWKKYIFNMQLTHDCKTLAFKANYADSKPYNGNILIDNLSVINQIGCEDYVVGNPNGKLKTILLIDYLYEIIVSNGNQMQFDKKKSSLTSDGYNEGEGIVRNAYFDRLIEVFEKYKNYKLIIRVKKSGKYTKQRVAFLYNYVFKYSKLKAVQMDILPYKAKDEAFLWAVDNSDIAISFDNL
jgi:hypothetical protein